MTVATFLHLEPDLFDAFPRVLGRLAPRGTAAPAPEVATPRSLKWRLLSAQGTWATTLEAMELDGSFANGAEACCDTVQNITCRAGVGTRQHPTFDSAQTLCDAPDTLNG